MVGGMSREKPRRPDGKDTLSTQRALNTLFSNLVRVSSLVVGERRADDAGAVSFGRLDHVRPRCHIVSDPACA